MKKVILTIVFLFISIVFLSYSFYYQQKVEKITNNIYKNKSKEITKLFEVEVDKKFGRTFNLTYFLSKDSELIKALLEKDNSKLDYKETINDISKHGEYKNLWIQIIDKDGYSFYRSWTNKIGDHAASARIDIAEMIKNPKPMKGISTGRFDMTFKTMIPLYHNDQFIGMIEMISKFNSIATILKEKQIEPLMVLHENYTDRFIKPFTGLFIGKNYIANLNASKELMEKVDTYELKNLMYIDKPTIFENYLVTTKQIKDVKGGEMAFFIFFYPQEHLDKSAIYSFTINYIRSIVIFIVFIILITLYLFYKNYSQELNKNVQEKTKKIDSQKEQLQSLLSIYDENIIFSKTDLKGNITYVSDAFCNISGYTREKLIGKPHNIIRHEDMKKEAFSNMWETIKTKKIWYGEVKNKTKDGGYYWVYAKVEPLFENNEHIGYMSTRTDITAKKDYEAIQEQMHNNSKMAAMGEMIGNIAHQWRQPLSVISTGATGMLIQKQFNSLDDQQFENTCNAINDNAQYLSKTIDDFKNFIKNEREFVTFNLSETISSFLNLVNPSFKRHSFDLILELDDSIEITGYPNELIQCFMNIFNNAKDALKESNIDHKYIFIKTYIQNNEIVILFKDNAGGIPQDIINRIFEPYFTTKHKSQGTGLGLSMTHNLIINGMNGEINVKNSIYHYQEKEYKGAEFIITLPS